MKHILITTIAAVVLVGNVFADSIHDVARFRNIQALKQAITDGADVNSKDGVGRTPFFIAVEYGKKEAAEFLIAKGADINVKYRFELSPLDLEVKKDRKKFVELLISKGADVNAKRGRSAGTALHFAAGRGHKEIAELLTANGADVNARDKNDGTPLDEAISLDRTEIADLLRKHDGKTGEELKAEGK